jgi:nitrogen fixation protein
MHIFSHFRVTALRTTDVIASVIVGCKRLGEPMAFGLITEWQRLRLKKGESRTDVENIMIILNADAASASTRTEVFQGNLVVVAHMPDQTNEPITIEDSLRIERRH